ncbi:MAG: helix-turn-helix transcriptional regulator [Actinomycetaceae bacterium]|nr:helix-turn-helix transcriptional regulator [Actinomycetaceae bacterium]
MQSKTVVTPLLREQIGDVLRQIRRTQGRTLREVSADAQVSLGYLSEVERGQKEASSELLVAISQALGVPLSLVLREVANRIAAVEFVDVPVAPAALVDGSLSDRITLLS